MSIDDLAPICNTGGGQLKALRAAMSRMEYLTQTCGGVVYVERIGRAWVVTHGTKRYVYLWVNYSDGLNVQPGEENQC